MHGAKPNDDGSYNAYFGREQPEGIPKENWVQTKPGMGWFVYLRLYGPEKPYFKKKWIPVNVPEIHPGILVGYLKPESLPNSLALILTEIAPDRADKILERGRMFGESRYVCNVHWQSDVVFLEQLKSAKAEYANAVKTGPGPQQKCH